MSTSAAPAPAGRTTPKGLSGDDVLEAAGRLVELHGVDALTMRRLADELGVAVTAIYWHVGNRDAVLDGLVDRLLAGTGQLPVEGDTPHERMAGLARSLRSMLLERHHLAGVVHERDRTPVLFQPVEQAMATELSRLGVRGAEAALALRALQSHVVASVLLARAAMRNASHGTVDPALWSVDWPDPELATELSRPADQDAVFEYGLLALLSRIGDRRPGSPETRRV